MLKYPFLDKLVLPFKIFCDSGIKIRKTAQLTLEGRVTLGQPDKSKAIISRLPVNIYIGEKANVKIGQSVSIGEGVNIIVKDNAELTIGQQTYFTSDAHIEAMNSISIGSNCAISWGITIIDDDHHTILPQTEKNKQKGSVQIGNHVWLGCNVTILKSTVIGNNCIVAAGSVVKGTFPDDCLIAGNPAKVVKQSINWE